MQKAMSNKGSNMSFGVKKDFSKAINFSMRKTTENQLTNRVRGQEEVNIQAVGTTYTKTLKGKK